MRGKVYKIICSVSEKFYIGSTLNELRTKWSQHKAKYKKWLNNNNESDGYCLLNFMRGIGDVKKFNIILIKEYDVADRKHLSAYESLWINKFWTSENLINKNHPINYFRTINDKHNYWKRKYRLQKYGNPDYVIQKKVPVSLKNCNNLEEKRLKVNEYMRVRNRIKKYGDPNFVPKRGRPSLPHNNKSVSDDDENQEFKMLRKILYEQFKESYSIFKFDDEMKERLIKNDVENFLDEANFEHDPEAVERVKQRDIENFMDMFDSYVSLSLKNN